jgi:hypothetical protein
MTNFPTQQHWFDSIWPLVSYSEDKRTFVPIQRHTDFEALEANISDNPNHTFILAVEDFDHFCQSMPSMWLRMPPKGGIPKNVWVGACVATQKEADERMKRLVKIRARKLFVLLKKNHPSTIDLKAGLIAWRCSLCGRKDGYNRMTRPKTCPSGSICEDATINPQIHWVVSMDEHKQTHLADLCAKMGVAFWDGKSIQVPE